MKELFLISIAITLAVILVAVFLWLLGKAAKSFMEDNIYNRHE